jgi:tetratricopeptide (TPR) repeat protein
MMSRKLRKSLPPLILLIVSAVWIVVPWQRWFDTKPAKSRPPVRDYPRMAQAAFERKRFDEVLRIGSLVAPDSVDAPAVYAIVGQAFLARGEVRNARMAFEESLNRKLEQPEILEFLAAIYLASGDAVRGLALLEVVAKLKPESFRPWLAMGKVRQDLGENAESATCYKQCLRRDPPPEEATQARKGLIRALMNDNRFSEADSQLDIARGIDPADAELLGMAAVVAQADGESASASELAGNCLEIDPTNADALLALAQVRFLDGNSQAAETLLLRADNVKPNQVSILQLLVQVQSRLGKTQEAAATNRKFKATRVRAERIDQLSKQISAEPENPVPRFELGQEAAAGGMDVLAEQCFRAALDIDPKFEPARMALEKLIRSRSD